MRTIDASQLLLRDENSIWIAGGRVEKNVGLDDSEIISFACNKVGPKLEETNYAPCVIKINSTTVALTGGHAQPLKKIQYYHIL